jgi:chromosome partitioning protein
MMVRLGRESVLKEALTGVRFDFVLLDCLPSLGILTINALVAANQVLIPTQCEYLALRSIALFYQTLYEVRAINPDLEVLGILPTFFDGRLLHAREVLAAMKRKKLPILDVTIGRSVRFAEATLAGESILSYARDHPGAHAYRKLAEVIDVPQETD